MSDIDFDELDKAVNSLMGNVKKPQDDDDTPKAKTLEVKDTLKPGEEPEYDKLGEVAQKIGSEALESEREQTLVEHFVPNKVGEDLAYDKLGEVASKIGNETLSSDDEPPKPAVETQKTEVTNEQPDEKGPEAPVVPVSVPKQSVVPRTAGAGRFMDVVHPSSDMRTNTSPSVSSRVISPLKPVQPSVVAQPAMPKLPLEDSAPVTPFLPDANEKIEKRPLGAIPSPFTDTPKEEPTEEKAAAENTEQKQAEEPVAAAETASINSEETIHQDEKTTKDDQQIIDATTIDAESAAEERELQKIESKEVASEVSESEATIESVESGDTESLRNGSASEHAGGAIYDVNEYHQPLAHAKKQKSGWGKVVIIILIIVIFAVMAGAAYFFLAA